MAFSFYLEFIGLSITSVCMVSGSGSCSVHCARALDTTFRSGGQDVTSKYTLYIYKMHIKTIGFFFQYQTRTTEWFDIFSRLHLARVLCKEYHVIE